MLMYMAMAQFFVGGIANINNLDVVMQGCAGKRVIAVDGDLLAFDLGDGNYHDVTFLVLCLELHAGFDVVIGVEHGAVHHLGQVGIVFPVGLCWLYYQVQLVTLAASGERIFHAGNDVAGTVQVAEAAVLGFINQRALVVFQHIIDGNNFVVLDSHNSFENLRKNRIVCQLAG